MGRFADGRTQWESAPPSRNGRLTLGLSRADDRILEIGPSLNPVVPKRDGWSVATLDHGTRDELVAKYEVHEHLDTSVIEDVDFVWWDGPLHESVPSSAHGTFDACLASHVIEHIPDLVGFFRSLATVLNEDATISMAVPDKRFCFDYFRPHSTTGDVLAAYHAGSSRHEARALFDYFAYTVSNDGAIDWGRSPPGELHFVNATQGLAPFDLGRFQRPAGAYEDCHGWQFTPSSFSLLVLELGALDLIDFRVRHVYDSEGCEFSAHLQRGRETFETPEELNAARLELAKGIVLELGEQADLLRASTPPASPDDTTPAAHRNVGSVSDQGGWSRLKASARRWRRPSP